MTAFRMWAPFETQTVREVQKSPKKRSLFMPELHLVVVFSVETSELEEFRNVLIWCIVAKIRTEIQKKLYKRSSNLVIPGVDEL